MSRSFRKNNIISITTCGYKISEKEEKRRAHKNLRTKSKQELHINGEDSMLPVIREVSNVWQWKKDGKQRISDWRNCPDKSLHFTKEGKLRK